MFKKFPHGCRSILVSVVFILCSGCATTVPKQSPETVLCNDPRIRYGQLKNGFRYAIMHNDHPAQRISASLHFDVGSIMEEEEERGIAHFLEHMAFRGSKHFPDGEIIERMQKLGAVFGDNINAYTSFYDTCYELDLPNSKRKTLDTAFSAFRDWCDGLIISKEDVQQERGVILSEKRDRKGVQQRQTKAWLHFLAKGTKIPHRFPIGQSKTISNFSAQDIRNFYEKWYSPERMFLAIAGDVNVKEIKRRICQTFGSLQIKPQQKPLEIGKLTDDQLRTFHFADPDLASTNIEIFTYFPDQHEQHTYAAQKYFTIIRWLINCLRERIMDKKIDDPSLFSGFNIVFDKNLFRMGSHSAISTEIDCEFSNWEDCLTLLECEIRKMKTYGVTNEELQRQKERSIKSAEQALEAETARTSSQIVSEIITSHNAKLSILSEKDSLDLIKRFAAEVTIEDCNKVLADFWNNFHIALFSNYQIDDAEKKILNIWERSRETAIEAACVENIPDFAYSSLDTPAGSIASSKYIADLGITQISMKNNVKINLKPMNFHKNQIQFLLNFGQGILTDYSSAKSGVFSDIDGAFLGGGLKKHPWKELRKIIMSKPISLGFFLCDQRFCFSGNSGPKDFPFLIELIAAYLREPAFEERALVEAKEESKALYEAQGKSPSAVFQNQYKKFITSNEVLLGLPDQELFYAVTNEDMKNVFLPILQSAPIEITVVGDFDVDEVSLLLRKIFGTFPERMKYAAIPDDIVKFPSDIPEKSFTFSGNENRTLLILAFQTDDFNNVKDKRQLTILSELVAERIRNQIRKEKGEVYSPEVKNSATTFKHFGIFEIILSLNPENVEAIKAQTLNILEDLKTTPAIDAELERIKLPILNEIRDNLRDLDFWSEMICESQRYPQYLDMLRTIEKDYKDISSQSLQETAQKYLINPVCVTIEPQK